MNRDPWHYGTWEGARDGMREDNLKLSLTEKIRLLEDMERFTLLLQRERHRKGLPVDPEFLPLVLAAVAEEQSAYPAKSTPPQATP